MRAAVYARFSSELQDERSIIDQVALARKYAESRGLVVTGVYQDAAISGASTINRPGLLRLLADSAATKFEIIVTESLDRLSRSQADIAALARRGLIDATSLESRATEAIGGYVGDKTRLRGNITSAKKSVKANSPRR